MSPQPSPVSTPIATPAGIGAPCSIAMVPIRPPIPRIDPTERSIPPAMMIIVIPSAMMLITAVCRTTLDRLVSVRKCGDAIESATNRTIRLRNGSSR